MCCGRGLLVLLSVLPALLLSGCFAGTAGTVLGILAATDDDGRPESDDPPQVAVIGKPIRVTGDQVLLQYLVTNDDPGFLEVKVEWQPVTKEGEVPFTPAREHVGPVTTLEGECVEMDGACVESDGTRHAAPGTFRFVWDARRDLREALGESFLRTRLRITVTEDGVGQGFQETEGFLAGNEPPQIVSVEKRGESGPVPFQIEVADSTEDPVNVYGSFQIGSDGEAWPMTLSDVNPDAPWKPHPEHGSVQTREIVWESTVDADGRAGEELYFTFFPRDLEEGRELEEGDSFPRFQGTLDNNSDPEVLLLDNGAGPDQSFDIPLRFLVRDRERNPVAVLLQWTRGFDDFPPLPLERLAERESLEQLVESPEQAELRRDLRILSRAPLFRLSGLIDAHVPPDGIRETDRIRETDFVRAGLVFHVPTASGSSSEWLSGFLVGQELRLFDEATDLDVTRRIEAFDPATCEATLSERLEEPLPRGTRYELESYGRLVGLPSSESGLLHYLVWDSLRDMRRPPGTPLDARIRVRALAVDAEGQIGEFSGIVLDLDNGFLRRRKTLITEQEPIAIAVGDVIGDTRRGGFDDLVVANQFSDTVGVYLQTRPPWGLGQDHGGVSTANRVLEPGLHPSSIALGDVNGDGLKDLVVANQSSLSVYANSRGLENSLELPSEPTLVLSPGTSFSSVAVGDVSGDGLDDIVAAVDSFGNRVHVYFQNKEHTIAAENPQVLTTPSRPRSVAVGYLNDDRLLDVAVASHNKFPPRYDTVSIFLQDSGRLSLDRELTPGERPTCVVIGDLDADGREDIVAVNLSSGTVNVYFQTADWSGFVLNTGFEPVAAAIGDVNQDGLADILVVNNKEETTGIFLQEDSGSGAFPALPSHTLRDQFLPSAVELADLNGDGLDDAAVANSESDTLNVYLQSTPASILPDQGQTLSSEGGSVLVLIGDVNGDGRNDVVNVSTSSVLEVYLQAESGNLSPIPSLTLPVSGSAVSGAIGDLDGDGRNDVVAAAKSESKSTVSVFLQKDPTGPPGLDAQAERVAVADQEIEAAADWLAVGDVTGDGRNDLVLVDTTASELNVYEGQGGPLPFPGVPSQGISTASAPTFVSVGDISGDGLHDVAVVSREENRVLVYHQDSGGLNFALALTSCDSPIQSAVGDLNGDGLDDLAVLCFLNKARVYFQGSFESPRDLDTGAPPLWMAVGDVSGDGRNDVVVAPWTSVTALRFHVQPEAGTLSSEPTHRMPVAFSASSVAIGDVSGDGRNDLVFGSQIVGALAVHLAR